MNKLSSKNYIRELLAENGLYAKKHFGQNFLTDAHVLGKIVAAAELDPLDLVLEIGPGLGVLTAELAKQAAHVAAIEIDKDLVGILRATVAQDTKNISIHNHDILKADIAALLEELGCSSLKVVANLPYYITSPVIFGLLEQGLPITSMVVMVQKEVADRFLAAPSTKAYGIPSLSLAYYGTASLVANVPPNCFHPRPDVMSAVIRIDVKPRTDINPKTFFPLVRAAFANRRKTLANNLHAHLGLSKTQAQDIIAAASLPEAIRGEALNLNDFIRLSSQL